MNLPLAVRYYGVDQPLPEQTELRAGPLSLIYESGDLRYIRLGERELLRRIYVAVRDHNWGTAAVELHNVQMDVADDHFAIDYDVVNRLGEIDFAWHGTITGDAQGTIVFRMAGKARSTFRRNRLGFCVLHPADCAGAACCIEHVDGTSETAHFPRQIAPQLVVDGIIKPVHPFAEMRALAHEVVPGLWAEVRFEGEIFEMEDQRNWTDASYKIYGTPLRLPFPVEVTAGTEIEQTITLRLNGTIPAAAGTGSEVSPALEIGTAPARPLPSLGVGIASHGQPLDGREIERLRALHLSHLRVELDLTTAQAMEKLRRASAEAEALNVGLDVALFVSDMAEVQLALLADQLAVLRPRVVRWSIFHRNDSSTARPWVELARTILGSSGNRAPVGGGTAIYFTQLNRLRPDPGNLDFVTYSFNPQVHAFDNASLVETLAAQAMTVESAHQIGAGKPVVVGPITLRPRANPDGSGPEPQAEPGQLPPQVDVRQMSLLGAGWTMGSIKYLAQSGVEAATYYETAGWRGVMERTAGSPLPDQFQSIAGGVYPLYHVLADVGEFAGGEVVPVRASHPLLVEGVSLRKGGRSRTLVANLSPTVQEVTLRNVAGHMRVSMLDEETVVEAMAEPERFRSRTGEERRVKDGTLVLTLRPYALARLDSL